MEGPWRVTQSERVRPYVEHVPGFVVAYDGDCQDYRDQETSLETLNRDFRPLEPAGLKDLELSSSWWMGFVICPGEPVAMVAQFVAELPDPYDKERVGLYLAPGVDEERVLREWHDHGAPAPEVVEHLEPANEPWKGLHPFFGRDHAEQIDDDITFRPDGLETTT